jgi:hypothetical protein
MEGTLEMDGDCNKGMGAVVLETPLGCNEEKGGRKHLSYISMECWINSVKIYQFESNHTKATLAIRAGF